MTNWEEQIEKAKSASTIQELAIVANACLDWLKTLFDMAPGDEIDQTLPQVKCIQAVLENVNANTDILMLFAEWGPEQVANHPKFNELIDVKFKQFNPYGFEVVNKIKQVNQLQKSQINEEVINVILEHLKTAPDSQLSPELVNKVKEFSSQTHSLKECYDFLNNISKESGDEASNFIKTLCNLEAFYFCP
ncbi:MAG: hypothetical protein LC122_11695 [Chitinophagales bacterium]|nr:hypothetical protein [Chitinophagales bacterium]